MTFTHVEYLLKLTPNVKNLFLWGGDDLLDAKKWEMLLSIQCQRLLELEFVCTGPMYDFGFDQEIHNFKQECKTIPFWIERNVLIPFSERKGYMAFNYAY